MPLIVDRPKPENIRWIAFDAVGTLIEPHPSVAEAYHRAAVRFGSALTVEEIAERFRLAFAETEVEATISPDDWQRSDRLQTSEEREYRRWQRIVRVVIDDANDPDACFEHLYKHFADPACWRCFAETAATLQALSNAGFRLAIASNFDHRLNTIRTALPDLQLVETCVVSSLVGYRKPSRLFFDRMIETIGVMPSEILMVGDDPINDVAGASAAGLPVVELARRRTDRPNSIDNLFRLVELLCA